MSGLPFVMEKDDRMVRAALDGEILAKQGAMVAYTGKVDFAFKGAGVGGMIRKAVTGEGQELMRVTGRGNVWFADNGSHISLFTLDADRLVVNGKALLVLGQGMGYEIKRTSGGPGRHGSRRAVPDRGDRDGSGGRHVHRVAAGAADR